MAAAVCRRGVFALLLGRRPWPVPPCLRPPPARRRLLSAAASVGPGAPQAAAPFCGSARRYSQVVDSPTQEGQLAEQDPEPPKDENEDSVFLIRAHGFPFACTKKEMMAFFDSCKIRNGENGIHFLLNRDGRRRGDALIELESKADVQKALEKNLRYMGTRYVKVHEIHDKDVDGLLQSLRYESQVMSDGVVLLRGLPFDSTEDDIADFFAGLRITDITFVYRGERKTGEAYVQFEAPEMVAKALLRHKEYMENRYIEVYISTKREMQRHLSLRKEMIRLRRELGSTAEERELDYSRGSSAEREKEVASEAAESSGPSSQSGRILSLRTVHVRGFPTQVSARDIVDFFAPLRPTRILIEYNSDGVATGEADVQFESYDDAVAAMAKEKGQLQFGAVELSLKEQPKAAGPH
ncbi:G-rich sequence factor 1 [Coturnix japonica]|uniref:G-rich RNA sequence binding factor 1 n=1 Tax=Coturnix japonica TaxID=93934 RepID=A0A8C2Y522_COTJA|nr:G-rich sequence factor 1 [Coturnix japonica]